MRETRQVCVSTLFLLGHRFKGRCSGRAVLTCASPSLCGKGLVPGSVLAFVPPAFWDVGARAVRSLWAVREHAAWRRAAHRRNRQKGDSSQEPWQGWFKVLSAPMPCLFSIKKPQTGDCNDKPRSKVPGCCSLRGWCVCTRFSANSSPARRQGEVIGQRRYQSLHLPQRQSRSDLCISSVLFHGFLQNCHLESL